MIIDEINKKISDAMVKKDDIVLLVFRSIMSEIQNKKIELRSKEKDITDDDVLKILQKEAKKRVDASILYNKGGRADLAQKEEEELSLIKELLPPELTDDELNEIIDDVISKNNFESSDDFGKTIKEVMVRVGSGANGSRVSELIRKKLK